MICLICRQSNLVEGLTSIPFERDEFRLLIRDVPAWVCPNCGEAVVEEQVATQLIRQAEDQFAEGIREAVCGYQSAAATDERISASSV
jgi:YgiT-type zinc finger domain-containing protein